MIVPLRNGRIIVADDNGVVLFTGYLIVEPARELAGAGTAGAVYQLVLNAVSDEVLLDWQTVPQTRATAGASSWRSLLDADHARWVALASRSTPVLATALVRALSTRGGRGHGLGMRQPSPPWGHAAYTALFRHDYRHAHRLYNTHPE